MLQCQNPACKASWVEFGSTYERVGGAKTDYYCRKCGSKRKPIGTERDSDNILVIGDTHLPFEHEGYLDFVITMRDKYSIKDENIYHVGDIVDNHAISMHEHDPDGMSSGAELDEVMRHIIPWYEAFPKMKICIGNHDALPQRQAVKRGLSNKWVRNILEVLDAPDGWEYKQEFWLNKDTKIMHGTGFSGLYPHANAAKNNMCNVVMGHTHSVAGVHWVVNERAKVFGMAVGCGIDRHSYAFNYASAMARKPVISCGVLLGGKTPLIELMDL